MVCRFHRLPAGCLLVLLLGSLPGGAGRAETPMFGELPAGSTATATRGVAAPDPSAAGRDLDCIALADVRRDHTPADLYPAVARCLAADRYGEAVELFALAGALGAFDRQRVADPAAPRKLKALIGRTIGRVELDKRLRLSAEVASFEADGSPQRPELCAAIGRLGPPDYHPAYLAGPGEGAPVAGGSRSGPAAPFDAGAAWRRVLVSYLHCP